MDSVFSHMYPYVVLGAFALFVLDRNRGREPISIFQAINLQNSHPIIRLGDMLITCILFGFIVYLLTFPSTFQQAVVAGLGTSGLLASLGKTQPASRPDEP